MFLLSDGLSLMISRVSLISNKYFLFSRANTLKLSKEGKKLQWSKWSQIALLFDGLNFFPLRGDTPICSPDLPLFCLALLTLEFLFAVFFYKLHNKFSLFLYSLFYIIFRIFNFLFYFIIFSYDMIYDIYWRKFVMNNIHVGWGFINEKLDWN